MEKLAKHLATADGIVTEAGFDVEGEGNDLFLGGQASLLGGLGRQGSEPCFDLLLGQDRLVQRCRDGLEGRPAERGAFDVVEELFDLCFGSGQFPLELGAFGIGLDREFTEPRFDLGAKLVVPAGFGENALELCDGVLDENILADGLSVVADPAGVSAGALVVDGARAAGMDHRASADTALE